MNDGKSNQGFLWILNHEQKWRSVFAASSDFFEPPDHPKLEVTYTPMKKYFYLKDHLGNIRVTVDENGDVKGYNDYYPFGLRMPGRSMNNAVNYALYKYSSKELDEENGINWYYFGARYYNPEVGRFLQIDRYDYKYPSLNPYHYVFNNPIRFTDFTGDTVDIDPKLLTPVVYTEGKRKGQSKLIEDMTPEEKQRYFFQLWWNNNKKEILSLFGIGGKYETTNILFKLGTYPRKWFGINLGPVKSFIGHTAWAKKGTDEGYFYHGGGFFDGGKLYSEGTVNPEFGIDELQINVYFNPNLSRDYLYTAPHEWKHVEIIFDAVKNGSPVPNGSDQHKIINNNNVPEIK